MIDFEELDFVHTPLGDLSLRRRAEPRLGDLEIFEVKLGDEFLMSSLFTESERALARIALSAHGGTALDVVVGGLGLGYTAAEALAQPCVASVLVVELMTPVIRWHRQHLVPLGRTLTDNAACRIVNGDFFACSADAAHGFDPGAPGRRFDAVLLDIDHSPTHLLSDDHASFYTPQQLATLQRHLNPDAVFALWSNDPPDPIFQQLLEQSFVTLDTHIVDFDNPYTDSNAYATVYLARV